MAYGHGQASPVWRTTLSCDGGACVRVAASVQAILIADSEQPWEPILSYTHTGWREFLAGIKNGDFGGFTVVEPTRTVCSSGAG